jgi:uncharacterized protein (TIGR01777 family)
MNPSTAHSSQANAPRRIAITGASGFVGSRLVKRLEAQGDDVYRLVRRVPASAHEIHWNPATGAIDANGLEGMDAVVNLAGVSIARGLWTAKRKKAIRDSRVDGTALLARTLASLETPPSVLVSTSAVGYYGDSGDRVLTETSQAGTDFLADVCVEWESAAKPAAIAGIRVVHPRFGLVLGRDAGILPIMSLPFKMGVGGKIGDGRQYMSWIWIDDLVKILVSSIENPTLVGAVNAVAPEPVTSAEFTKAMGRALKRPTFMTVPAFAAKAVGGEMVQQLILVSQRAIPERLQRTGFAFSYPTIDGALAAAFGPAPAVAPVGDDGAANPQLASVGRTSS